LDPPRSDPQPQEIPVLRNAFATLAALALGLSAASADELKGTLKKVNTTANSLTVTIDGKDRTLPVSKDASFVNVSTEKGKKGKSTEKLTPIDGGLGALKEGSPVTVLTEKADDKKETVTSVKVGNGTAKKAKKAKKPKTVASKLQLISTTDEVSKKAEKKKGNKGGKHKKGKHKKGKKGKKSKKTNTDI
jgi:hypothetical protein